MTTVIHVDNPVTGETPNAQALFEEARRLRRRRWALGLALLLVAGIGGGFILGSGNGGGASGPSGAIARFEESYPSLEHPSRATTQAILDYLLPTSGADFANGWRYVNARQAAMGEDMDACLASKGFHEPLQWGPLSFSDPEEFPWLSYIQAVGFGPINVIGANVPDPTIAMSATEAASYRSATTSCRIFLEKTLWGPIEASESALQNAWQNVLSEIDTDSMYQRSLKGWRSCMAQAGIHVSSVDGFFSYLDRGNRDGLPYGPPSAAEAYARCIAGPEAIRDGLRRKARVAFMAAHATAVNQQIARDNTLLR